MLMIAGVSRTGSASDWCALQEALYKCINKIQYNTIQYNTIQYNTMQYNAVQCNTIQYNAIQYNAIQYNTMQYNTTPVLLIFHNRQRSSNLASSFILYIAPLSKLISSSSVDHHLYADDTQLFISFSPYSLQDALNHIRNTITQISACMTTNPCLCLNPSKTEFLIIGLREEFSKLTYSSDLVPTDLTSPAPYTSPVRNLGVIFDKSLMIMIVILMIHTGYANTEWFSFVI